MLKQFLDFIANQKLGDKFQQYLLAVSGGVDSIVMCDLFFKAGLKFGIAHCNFNLRGKESEGDESFVKRIAQKYNVPFHKKSFNTKLYAEKKKISVQMAARDLRYEWLKQVANKEKYDRIATAHHLDDSIETFFINILRGTGIAGLQGVPVKRGNIIRPLLFAKKKMICDYALENKLTWREDSSNLTDTYLRNAIRHHVIPLLKKFNQNVENTIVKELSYFKAAAEVFKKFVEEKKQEIISEEGKNILISIKKLKESGYAEALLYEILRAYDFTPETTELIAKRMYTIAGKKFFSPTYRLIKDREFFILTANKPQDRSLKTSKSFSFPEMSKSHVFTEEKFLLKKKQKEFRNENIHLKIETFKGNISQITDKSPSVAYLDMDMLEFPLMMRKWKKGDFFYPLGMKGKKKISDFLTDLKIPLHKKEEVWLLFSGNAVAWVVGYRISDRFKITEYTRNVYKVRIIQKNF